METQQNTPYGSCWKLSKTLPMGRVGNSAKHSLWVVLETQQNTPYGSCWKLSKTLPMGRVLGRSTGRVVESSSWYFMKIESDSVVSQ
ncbi:hypothetical protein [Leptospira noguchii]|uniref:Uncharacterized protein n=1 Tax=Leptospira noguchii TaxID=28182 RepID=A0AAE9K7P4_9LEPT|nr:hypothetical protein [Leptospira noguchii]UOG56295.1 hypothetical protein MAL03_16015 [Leptospira noguchii]